MSSANLQQQAYRHIRRKLVYPSLVTKGSLSDRNLARELGISRTPVREAIRKLELEGLIEQRPRSGTYLRRINLEEWMNLWDVRELLEGYSAFRAASRITPVQLDELDRRNEQMLGVCKGIKSGKFKRWDAVILAPMNEADMKFHGTLLRAGNNPSAATMVERCQILARAFDSLSEMEKPVDLELYDRLMETCDEHRAIVDALRCGDANGARDAVLKHLGNGREYCLKDMQRLRMIERTNGETR